MSWLQIQKIVILKCCLSYSTQQWTIFQSDCDLWWKVDFIWQLVTTSSLAGLRSYKELPKAKLAPKKGHGHCLLPVWSTTIFVIPEKPLHLRSMLNKSMRFTENCNACRQHWSTERTQFFFQQHLTACCVTNTSKVEQIGLRSIGSSTIFTWSLTNWLPLLQASQQLLQGKYFHNQQEAENAF